MISGVILFAVFYVSGIFLASNFDMLGSGLLLVVFLVVNLCWYLIFKKYNKMLLLVVCGFLLGVTLGNGASDNALRNLKDLEERYVTIEGRISALPEQDVDGNYKYLITTGSVSYREEQYPTGDQVLVTAKERYAFGDTIKVCGFLKNLHRKMNKHDFDMARYYKSRGIFYRMYAEECAKSDASIRMFTLSFYVNGLKNEIATQIDKHFSGADSAIMKAILVGNKHFFSEDFETLLYRTNTMRYFYSPYIHLTILLGIIGVLFGGLRKAWRDYVVVGVLLLYAIVNCSTPIMMKSALLFAISILFTKRYGYTHFPDLLAIVVLIVTLQNPLYAFDIGFVLSVVSSILIYNFRDYVEGWLWFVRGRAVRKVLSVWLVSVIGVAPLCAYFFNRVTIYSGLFMVLYLPIIAGILLVSPLYFLIYGLFGVGLGLDYALDGWLFLLKVMPLGILRLPGHYINIARPSILFLAIFYSGLVLLKWAEWGEHKTFKFKAVSYMMSGFVIAMAISFGLNLGKFNLTFVNVGQGDGAILHRTLGETILIDGGGGEEFSSYDAGEKIYLPYLIREGYHHIDYAVVSHYHRDHCLGIIAAIKNLKVKNLVMPATMSDNPYRIELERLAQATGTVIHFLEPGDEIALKSGLVMRVLSPNVTFRNEYIEENDTSMVIEVQYGEFQALFTGDITQNVEEQIHDQLADYDLVKIPHHGSVTSSSEEFISKTKPEVAIVSVGENNVYNLPNDAVIERYRQNGARVLDTSKMGDITIWVDQNARMEFQSYRTE